MDFVRLGNDLFAMPDGSNWFLVDEQKLITLTATMRGVLVDPLKTTIVQNQTLHDHLGHHKASSFTLALVPPEASQ
jgi:hypothetical protein